MARSHQRRSRPPRRPPYRSTRRAGSLTYKTEGDRKTTWITEYLVKQDEDIRLIEKYMPVPTPRPRRRWRKNMTRSGTRGILRGFVWGDQAGCWQHAACLMDINELILATFDKPDWVHALLKILLAKKMRFIESDERCEVRPHRNRTAARPPRRSSRPSCMKNSACPTTGRCMMPFTISASKSRITPAAERSASRSCIVRNGADVSETLAPPTIGGNQEPWEFAAQDRPAGWRSSVASTSSTP